MKIQIQKERLAATFTELCEIDSPSRKEGRIAAFLKDTFTKLGASSSYEDNSASKTGSESGNLIFRFDGNLPDQEGLFFSCHMDTVEPATGIEVIRKEDIFTSKGDTILGGDDKSGIAAIIEALSMIKENDTPHPMIEVIITTCEEIGLVGAKNLEYNHIQTKYGYALDSSGINHVILGAPAANKIEVEVRGLAAHAGLCPEAGINALTLAVTAMNKIPLGRLDDESTSNFGVISGGMATNIIPDLVLLKGEVRSHSVEKLASHTKTITDIFQRTVSDWQGNTLTGEHRPSVKVEIVGDYPVLAISHDAPVVKRVQKAAILAGKNLKYIVAGGGSDANIFCGHDLPTAIVATGMNKVHTIDEQLDLNDLISVTELVYALAIATDQQ